MYMARCLLPCLNPAIPISMGLQLRQGKNQGQLSALKRSNYNKCLTHAMLSPMRLCQYVNRYAFSVVILTAWPALGVISIAGNAQ